MTNTQGYEVVEQKILKTLKLGVRDLSLNGLLKGIKKPELANLMNIISQLTQLRWLDLSCNNMEEMPESLIKLKQLNWLDLSNNKFTSLPKSLGQIEQLESLDLSNNQLTKLPESLGDLRKLHWFDISNNGMTEIPNSMQQLRQLQYLNISHNNITEFPEWFKHAGHLFTLRANVKLLEFPSEIGCLLNLRELTISGRFDTFPPAIRELKCLERLGVVGTEIKGLPYWLNELKNLTELDVSRNKLTDLPASLEHLRNLTSLNVSDNPLNPELSAAYADGLEAVKRYIRAKAAAHVVLNEAKLILVGEGEVGKSCLLGALRGDPWEEGRPSTHGIEIKPVKVIHPETGAEITLNGWDFGGQRFYRPTHQLFFSAPAVYLIVWKPREGFQTGAVQEWIKLVTHREPEAKIFVVATHGGPNERQPDINRQELWDMFGKETILDFFHVEDKPTPDGERLNIPTLKEAIARLAAKLPGVGREVPRRWQETREVLRSLMSRDTAVAVVKRLVADGVLGNEQEALIRLQRIGDDDLLLECVCETLQDLSKDNIKTREGLAEALFAYLPLEKVLSICRKHKMEEEEAKDFVRNSHRLGHLIHYDHDPILRDIVVLKPDWLATAISFVLSDKVTREGHGLVSFARLGQLWDDPVKEKQFRYQPELHHVFLRLMERYDLSYRVVGLPDFSQIDNISLIAQLVPDERPEPIPGWDKCVSSGDEQQVQICRIVDERGQSANAEGLFYQLIVRLHKYSLGRINYRDSVHWQRGLVLDNDYNGRALLEHTGNDVRITVRAPFPVAFLSVLTHEVKWLVENFWKGLRCDVTVPCLELAKSGESCIGLIEVSKLIENKKQDRPEMPCPVCNKWQSIDELLRNAPAAHSIPMNELVSNREVSDIMRDMRKLLLEQHMEEIGRFDKLDSINKQILSKVDAAYTGFMRALTDEAKEGPRLFSFEPIDPSFFDRPSWISQKFRLTLWCEHSRLSLPQLNGGDNKAGVYELNLPREWFEKASPFLKVLTGTLSLVLPVASSATKVLLDDATYKGIEKQLDLGQKSIDSVLKGGEKSGDWLGRSDAPYFENGEAIRAESAVLRQLHAWLKEKDPAFGGLVRVMNKQQEFLWVHQQFESEY